MPLSSLPPWLILHSEVQVTGADVLSGKFFQINLKKKKKKVRQQTPATLSSILLAVTEPPAAQEDVL